MSTVTKYQQEAEQLKALISKGEHLGEEYDRVGNLVSVFDLLENQKQIIQLLLGRLQRYETAHQAFVAAIQGSV